MKFCYFRAGELGGLLDALLDRCLGNHTGANFNGPPGA
jgi:hypothetical protein